MDSQNNNGFGTENQQNNAGQQSYYSQNNTQSYYSQSNDQQSYYGQTVDQNTQQNMYGQTTDQTAQQNAYGQTTDQTAQQNAYGQTTDQYAQQNVYGQNTYGQNYTQYNQQNTYGQQNYSAYGNNANNGMGGAPLDKNGQPMKNRFGMKMTFAILEIIFCNLISLICGIIACVFTAKANTSYKEGRWEDFKSQAKTSAICLWVGLAGVIIAIIVSIASVVVALKTVDSVQDDLYDYEFNYEDYDYDYDYSYDTETEETETEEVPETEVADTQVEENTETPAVSADIVPGEGFTTPSITVEGVEITLPISYADLKANGFYVEAEDEEYILNKDEYDFVYFYTPSGVEIGYAYIANLTDAAIPVSEGTIIGLDFYYSAYKDATADFVLYNGVTQNATPEDLITAFGTPDDEYYGEDDYIDYQWYNHNDEYYDTSYNSIEFIYMDGELYEMTIRYLGWD